MIRFSDVVDDLESGFEKEDLYNIDDERIIRAIESGSDLTALLSHKAATHLEAMAVKARKLTSMHFGKSISLYTPLYLGNYCVNSCIYCAYNLNNHFERKVLTVDEAATEAGRIHSTGLRHILLLSGEDRKRSSVEYFSEVAGRLSDSFPSISIETYPMETYEYEKLVASGVQGISIYQETYDKQVYSKVHPKGPKSDYYYRLETPSRAAAAGMRSIGIGALLGISDWRKDAFMSAVHAKHLMDNHPGIDISLSVPRIRPFEGGTFFGREITDREFVQVILAYRIFLPNVGITISTRESQKMRDGLMGLAPTSMSAGVSTKVGSYKDDNTGQFEISDIRTVDEMVEAIRSRGCQSVLKDWDWRFSDECIRQNA